MNARTASWQLFLATLALGPDPSIVPHPYQHLPPILRMPIIRQHLSGPNGRRCKPRARFRLLTVIMKLKLMVCRCLPGRIGLHPSSPPFTPVWDPRPIPGSYMRMVRAWWIPFKASLTWYIRTQDTVLSLAIRFSRWYVTSSGPRDYLLILH